MDRIHSGASDFSRGGVLNATSAVTVEYQEQLQKLEVQSADMKQKLRQAIIWSRSGCTGVRHPIPRDFKTKESWESSVCSFMRQLLGSNLRAAYAGMLVLFTGGASCSPPGGIISHGRRGRHSAHSAPFRCFCPRRIIRSRPKS